MFYFKELVFGAFLTVAVSVHAQGMVASAMGSRVVLKAYIDANGKSEPTLLNVKDLTFPLKIFEISETGFVHVKVADQDVWLDRKQIRIPPETLTASCATVDQTNKDLQAGGTRGANSGCK